MATRCRAAVPIYSRLGFFTRAITRFSSLQLPLVTSLWKRNRPSMHQRRRATSLQSHAQLPALPLSSRAPELLAGSPLRTAAPLAPAPLPVPARAENESVRQKLAAAARHDEAHVGARALLEQLAERRAHAKKPETAEHRQTH